MYLDSFHFSSIIYVADPTGDVWLWRHWCLVNILLCGACRVWQENVKKGFYNRCNKVVQTGCSFYQKLVVHKLSWMGSCTPVTYSCHPVPGSWKGAIASDSWQSGLVTCSPRSVGRLCDQVFGSYLPLPSLLLIHSNWFPLELIRV